MENNICKCTHSKDEHVTVHIQPDGVNGKITGHILKCSQCLCQGFEPKERVVEKSLWHMLHWRTTAMRILEEKE